MIRTDKHSTDATTWMQRFVEALTLMCGARPPLDMCEDWVDNVQVNGMERLQTWVLCQPRVPSWAQGIVTIEAAELWADMPVEGERHSGRDGAAPAAAAPKQELPGWGPKPPADATPTVTHLNDLLQPFGIVLALHRGSRANETRWDWSEASTGCEGTLSSRREAYNAAAEYVQSKRGVTLPLIDEHGALALFEMMDMRHHVG